MKSLRDDLIEWVSEYPAIANHGWSEPEVTLLADELWEFLAEKIGPVQEKLLNDVELARQRQQQSERNEERALRDLERFIADHPST